jgi:hypothetical protein
VIRSKPQGRVIPDDVAEISMTDIQYGCVARGVLWATENRLREILAGHGAQIVYRKDSLGSSPEAVRIDYKVIGRMLAELGNPNDPDG